MTVESGFKEWESPNFGGGAEFQRWGGGRATEGPAPHGARGGSRGQ